MNKLSYINNRKWVDIQRQTVNLMNLWSVIQLSEWSMLHCFSNPDKRIEGETFQFLMNNKIGRLSNRPSCGLVIQERLDYAIVFPRTPSCLFDILYVLDYRGTTWSMLKKTISPRCFINSFNDFLFYSSHN